MGQAAPLSAHCRSKTEFLRRFSCLLKFCTATRIGLALLKLDHRAGEPLPAVAGALGDESLLNWQDSDALYVVFPNPSGTLDLTFSQRVRLDGRRGAGPVGVITVQNPVHSSNPEYWFRHLRTAAAVPLRLGSTTCESKSDAAPQPRRSSSAG